MAEIVNLRQARKAKSRAEARAKGDANAAKHGRSKAGKARDDAEREAGIRKINGHRRERDGDDATGDDTNGDTGDDTGGEDA
ncbi:DUF4169 family protein [Rhodovulum sp. DZ06]|uniref:DUF4169 family protein n=1 Tax=Rhodovulum sp. DZ06 TaxID=3425126 RepID=UPI003D32AA89